MSALKSGAELATLFLNRCWAYELKWVNLVLSDDVLGLSADTASRGAFLFFIQRQMCVFDRRPTGRLFSSARSIFMATDNAPQPNQPRPTNQQTTGQTGAQAPGDDDGDLEQSRQNAFLLFLAVPSWLVSVLFHIVLVLILAMLVIPGVIEDEDTGMVMGPKEDAIEETEELVEEEFEEIEVDSEAIADVAPDASETPVPETADISPANDLSAAPAKVELNPLGEQAAPKNDLLATVGAYTGTGVDGRGSASRGALVQSGGGTKGSEAAVALALRWLSNHQAPDGGWTFDHAATPGCNARCRNSGSGLAKARNGATAMGLLPFLGAGQTHMEGDYKLKVKAGLRFLLANGKVKSNTLSFHEPGGSMYSHGLASIALCEAYAMTHDKDLLAPAQMALNFIVYAQDPVGGGWRYSPRQAGDTSAVGWQLMALKSGHMAYLKVPPQTVKNAMKFLDTVQSDSGAKYGYTTSGSGQSTTAVGLLCRMYLGWKHDEPALGRGTDFLAKTGPSLNNMYYSYYATQVMRHYEGDKWKEWNEKMRDPLISAQSKTGHETGSWHMTGGHASKAGRLYSTSMATMILEVYYRHLPIFRKQAAEEDFPL